jgi:hypothetical protein
MAKWEYKIEINIEEPDREFGLQETVLNQLGQEEWEFVSVVSVSIKAGGQNRLYFFKREIL